jgi:hypothetical protein
VKWYWQAKIEILGQKLIPLPCNKPADLSSNTQNFTPYLAVNFYKYFEEHDTDAKCITRKKLGLQFGLQFFVQLFFFRNIFLSHKYSLKASLIVLRTKIIVFSDIYEKEIHWEQGSMSGESTWNLMCTEWHCYRPLTPAHPFPSSKYYCTIAPYSLAYHRSCIVLASLNKALLGPTFCSLRQAHTFHLKEQPFKVWQSLPSKLRHMLTKQHVITYQKSMLFRTDIQDTCLRWA